MKQVFTHKMCDLVKSQNLNNKNNISNGEETQISISLGSIWKIN